MEQLKKCWTSLWRIDEHHDNYRNRRTSWWTIIIKWIQKIPHCRKSSKTQSRNSRNRDIIDTPNTHIHDRPLYCFCTGISTNSGGIILVLRTQTLLRPLSESMRSFKCFPPVNKMLENVTCFPVYSSAFV